MNCSDAIELLDRMIFEDVQIDAGLKQHLDTCSSCNQVYRDALKAREVMNKIRHSEPVLSNPGEFTDNIISAIPPDPQRTAFILLYLQRMLAAAAVAIFLLFGYEQYGVVKKVSALEIQLSAIKTDSRYSDPLRMASAININNAGISFSEIPKLLSAVKGTTPLSYTRAPVNGAPSPSFIKKRLNQRNIK
jgi:hypothetical protein